MIKYSSFIAVTITLFLSGCMSTHTLTNKKNIDVDNYKDQPSFCNPITNKTINQCVANNGLLKKQGRTQCYYCTIEYADAGKTCADENDCMGKCYRYAEPVPINKPNQTGVCARNNILFGCHQAINNGMATQGMICID